MDIDPIQLQLDKFKTVMVTAKQRRDEILAAKQSGMKNSQIMQVFGIRNRARLFQILAKAGWKSNYKPRQVKDVNYENLP
jgi:hypothetical protein